jgi:hypothetical protein
MLYAPPVDQLQLPLMQLRRNRDMAQAIDGSRLPQINHATEQH